ncbi:MAG: 1,4-alpha-glucan branching protein GlgB [Pseudomonadota bacterium]
MSEALTVIDWRTPAGVVDELMRACHDDPCAWLGMHEVSLGVVVRALISNAERVVAVPLAGGPERPLLKVHPDGYFEGLVGRDRFDYFLRVTTNGHVWEVDDAYRYGTQLSAHDLYLFNEGSHERLYDWLGAQPVTVDGVSGTRFAVWAPNARRVSVVGDFNLWDARRHCLRRHPGAGIWELFVPGAVAGQRYKFDVLGAHGHGLQKTDPLALATEPQPGTAGVISAAGTGSDAYQWGDDDWLAARTERDWHAAPLSIYELHLGSWRRKDANAYLSYAEVADELVPYVLEHGFTHVQFMPLAEYPFDGSWGYQPVSLFAATARFGAPDELRLLIDRLHQAGIGVLVDWVPAHFPGDGHGLERFDGTCLYEHEDPRRGRHPDWDTLIYNYGRREVVSFLLSSAFVWIDRFHVDGLRVDAVASMLYLDYSRENGEWLPNEFGGRENIEAEAFLRELNTRLHRAFPGVLTIAEESTAWPGVTNFVHAGGLGFDFKWNMGWMHDTLSYMGREPVHRSWHHDQLTFGMVYAFHENFVLPLSHDEVVHGKGTLLGRMPGDRWQQFANLRAYYGFMWAHPGKKLLFMGGEFAQEREWNHDQSLDWHLLAGHEHRGMQALVGDLNGAYRERAPLHELDGDEQGFRWLIVDAATDSLLAFERRDRAGNSVVVVCNFTPVVRHEFRLGVPRAGAWRELLNSDSHLYGGSNVGNVGAIASLPQPAHGCEHSVVLTVPPLATLYLALERAPQSWAEERQPLEPESDARA